MVKSFYNSGVITLNKKSWNITDQRTIIVIGVARSGTSLVTSILEGLGVNMGDKKSYGSFEDEEIYSLIESANFNFDELRRIVNYKNSKYRVWGWKRPKSFEYAHKFESLIVNPIYVIPFRDVLAISNRNEKSDGITHIKALRFNINRYMKLLNFIEDNENPIFLFSYEKALEDKTLLIWQLSEFLGIPLVSNNIPPILENIEIQQKEYMETLMNKNNKLPKSGA